MAYRQTKAVEARLLDNRARILRVARDLVSEGGWSAAVVANVAAAADIATGTVYRYFASKSELYSEVLGKVSQREVDGLREIASTAESPPDRLHAAVSAFVRRPRCCMRQDGLRKSQPVFQLPSSRARATSRCMGSTFTAAIAAA